MPYAAPVKCDERFNTVVKGPGFWLDIEKHDSDYSFILRATFENDILPKAGIKTDTAAIFRNVACMERSVEKRRLPAPDFQRCRF